MFMKYKSYLISFSHLLISIFLFCVSCSKRGCTDPNALNYSLEATKDDNSCEYQDFDKHNLLINLADNYIIPSLNNFKDKIVALDNQVDEFNLNTNNNNLNNLRATWDEALLSWQDAAFLDFGPSEYILLRSQTNTFPVDTTELKTTISDGSWNLQFSNYNDSKGLQALDYMLFMPGYSESELIGYFQTNINSKNYLKAITVDLLSNITYVCDEWSLYRDDFVNDFETSSSGYSSNSQGSSISNMINALCLHYEFYVRRGKVGLPLGVFNGFTQQELPHLVECYFSGKSLQNLNRSVYSINKFIIGAGYGSSDNGLGLDDYMNFVNAESNSYQLSNIIDNQFTNILEKVNNLPGTLGNDIIFNKPMVQETYQELQKLVPLIKVDMTSALGVLITYQDNDGD